MQLSAYLIFLLLAFICFVLAAFGVPARIGWRDMGYAFVVLAFILT